jgi:hypothetical protein
MGYVPKIEWEDNATNTERLRAIYNFLNNLLFEMYGGRVPSNKEELQNNIDMANAPLSIAFVTLAEKGEIDEVTASENLKMFLPWGENVTYNAGDLRTYSNEQENEEGIIIGDLKLYKCLQAHTSQADWTPDVSPALWKVCGISENGIPEWSQPISTSDAYMTGDEVMYNGVHYRSLVDNNVWSPTVYPQGWEVVE